MQRVLIVFVSVIGTIGFGFFFFFLDFYTSPHESLGLVLAVIAIWSYINAMFNYYSVITIPPQHDGLCTHCMLSVLCALCA
jgi:hypothetical protein